MCKNIFHILSAHYSTIIFHCGNFVTWVNVSLSFCCCVSASCENGVLLLGDWQQCRLLLIVPTPNRSYSRHCRMKTPAVSIDASTTYRLPSSVALYFVASSSASSLGVGERSDVGLRDVRISPHPPWNRRILVQLTSSAIIDISTYMASMNECCEVCLGQPCSRPPLTLVPTRVNAVRFVWDSLVAGHHWH